jgi:ketosteroid isomerase-like protein
MARTVAARATARAGPAAARDTPAAVQENVERVRRGYQSYSSGDVDALDALWREWLPPEFEFHSILLGNVYRGPEGTSQLLEELREVWEEYAPQVEEIVEIGHHVVVVFRLDLRGRGSGVPVSETHATVWTFDGTMPLSAHTFGSKEAALEFVSP